MIEVHEHMADSEVIKKGIEATDYQKYLLLQLKSGQFLKLTSNFNYSLTKKRITMISKNISKRKSIARTLLGLILVAGIFMFYGFNNQMEIEPALEIKTKYSNDDSSDFIPSILPLKAGGEYYIGSHYGMRTHPILKYKKKHIGIDIVAKWGTEVIAPANGKVLEVENTNGYGKRVKIKHNESLITLYAHLSDYKVKVGDNVRRNDVIGLVGETGLATSPHLHYEVIKNNNRVNKKH